ncbi:toll/interleukin-1 receptor domain-containing protein [Scytonema sp. PCC 10023]|uniref:toll/interleukin-1 receptor domain-containing protein n=1 Tax=Scytonema sp. PCC 10023 TaxID=1680591 RepID=UPI0039C706CA
MSFLPIFTRPIKIFFCYSHKDQKLRDKLEPHLSSLKQEPRVKINWYKYQTAAGRDWKQENNRYLNRADLIILLVSPEFVDSEHGRKIVKRAMERCKAGKAHIIPIKLRPIDNWQNTPFSELQYLPDNGQPVTNRRFWATHDEAFVNIAEGIRVVVEKLSNSASTGILTSHRESRATIVPVVKVVVASVVVVGVGVVLVGSMLLISQRHNLLETPLSEANPTPNSIQYVTPIGWIQIGLVNNTSNSLIFGDKLLQTTDPQIIDLPTVPSRNTIVTIKQKVDLREKKSPSSRLLDKLQPGEKLKLFEVELLGESTDLPHRQVWAQVGKCNQICDK